MQEPSAVGRIIDLVRDLRQRCPWDAAQTPETLRPYLVEEALELDHAIAERDRAGMRTELGDLLLHVAFQVVLAEERGDFGPDDLTRAVEEKMWRRHPHLFPTTPQGAGREDGPPGDTDTVPHPDLNVRWERAKRAELASGSSALDGLPPTLPALVMAYRLQEKAAGVGFDWSDHTGPLAKIHEELTEVEAEIVPQPDRQRLEHEIGDLFFALVNLARKLAIDPRAALEGANRRFRQRFHGVERLAAEHGVEIGRASLEELDALWEHVKQRDQG